MRTNRQIDKSLIIYYDTKEMENGTPTRFSLIKKKYLRLNIAKKLMLGYIPLSVLTVIIALFALLSLERINQLNETVIHSNVPIIECTESMVECIYSQELAGKRFAIVKSPQSLELFNDCSAEFKNHLATLRSHLFHRSIEISRLLSKYNRYIRSFREWFDISSRSGRSSIDSRITRLQGELIGDLEKLGHQTAADQREKSLETAGIANTAFWVVASLCMFSLIVGVSAALLITRNISGAVSKLKTATREISNANFDHIPSINNQDELGDLNQAFLEMATRLKRLEEMYLDASPLTHLPGGIAIDNVLKKRTENRQPLAFCLVDLDNFKAFNDRYGYARGNQVIRFTARIIEETARSKDREENFIGHIGGDDFVIICPIRSYRGICQRIIKKFDREIPTFYDPEDIKKGYIRATTRQGKRQRYPIMTLSISVVTNQSKKDMYYLEFGERAAELKEYVKSIPGSQFMLERRKKRSPRPPAKESP